MPTNTNVTNLKINKLTEAQYDAAVQDGTIGENEISILTDVEPGQIIQVDTLPTAAAAELGKIYQFVGTTDANYTNGYFYKCVSDGQNPATYSWTQTNVQPTPSGLPSQTGNAGKFLTTDGTDASWSDKPLVNNTTDQYGSSVSILGTANNKSNSVSIGLSSNNTAPESVSIGYNSTAGNAVAVGVYTKASSQGSVAIGTGNSIFSLTEATSNFAIAIGANAKATAQGAIQINSGTNSEKGTLCVGLYGNSFQNVKLLDSDGTIPTDRFTTTPSADGTYVPTLSISSGVATRSWAAPADPLPSQTGNAGKFLTTDGTTTSWVNIGSTPSTMPTLLAANWSSNTQTVSVTGVTATNVVMVAPAPVNATEYAQCGILCTAQAAGTLTFTCTSVPTNDITVNVVCF